MCDVLTKRSEVQDMGGAARREAGIIFVNLLLAGRSSDTPAEPHTRCCTMCVFLFLLLSDSYVFRGTNQSLCRRRKGECGEDLICSIFFSLETESALGEGEKRISYNSCIYEHIYPFDATSG